MVDIIEWLFGSDAENSFSESDDTAIMQYVKSRIGHSYIEPETKTKEKLSEAAKMRVWAKTLKNRAEKKSYLSWISYCEDGCVHRLKDEARWRAAKEAESRISKPPASFDC